MLKPFKLVAFASLLLIPNFALAAGNCALNDVLFNNVSSEQQAVLTESGAVCSEISGNIKLIFGSEGYRFVGSSSCELAFTIVNKSEYNFKEIGVTATAFDSNGNMMGDNTASYKSIRPNVEKSDDGLMFHKSKCDEIQSIKLDWSRYSSLMDGTRFTKDGNAFETMQAIAAITELEWFPSFEVEKIGALAGN